MKKTVVALVITMLMAAIAYAGTGGGTAPSVGGKNIPNTVPKVSKSVCTTMTAGKTGSATVSVTTTTMVNWKAFASDTDSTPVVVKRVLNSNTAYMPSSGEYNLPIEGRASSLVFKKFSSADNSVTPRICADIN